MESCDTEIAVKIIAEIANSIQEGIQVTVDWPENNDDDRMPVLDLKVWIEKSQKLLEFPTLSIRRKLPLSSPY